MPTTHQQVIENFIREGTAGRGKYIVAREKDQAVFSNYHSRWVNRPNDIPLAVRLTDDGFLANGASLDWPSSRHQRLVLRTLESSKSPFGVVPFDSITAAWTDGEVRDWNQASIPTRKLRKVNEVCRLRKP